MRTTEVARRILEDFASREPFIAARIGGANLTRHVKALVAEGVRAGIQSAQDTEEPEGEHVFIEWCGMYHAKFGGISGDVSSLTLTREAWKALGEADALAVSVVPVEQGDET